MTPSTPQNLNSEKLGELDRFHPTYCDKYEPLRGIYPNDRRLTGKDCTCGFYNAIESYASQSRRDELEKLIAVVDSEGRIWKETIQKRLADLSQGKGE